MEDGQPAHPGVEDADRPRNPSGDCRSGLRWCPMQRLLVAACPSVLTLAAAAPRGACRCVHGHRRGRDDGRRRRHRGHALPAGRARPARVPGVMLFHGLGGNRSRSPRSRSYFAENGYVALTFDFRGHGQSGGLFSGLGARELADVAILRERWLPEHSQVSDRVGGWGISLGGGALLRSIGEGEPFAAAEVVETWTDLYDALVPQGLPKSGAIFQFLGAVPRSRQAPELLAVERRGRTHRLPALKAFAGARSSRQLLGAATADVLLPGTPGLRVRARSGARRLPAAQRPEAALRRPVRSRAVDVPRPDFELQKQRALAWFDRYLKGIPNGIENAPKVELVPESGGTPVGSASLPRTVTHFYCSRAARRSARRERSCAARGSRARSRPSARRPSTCARARRLAGRTSSRCSSRGRPTAGRSS